ncbi:PAS domain-containing protein [Streptomyces sp. NPDC091272]|uniref:PAS domain-containing protein n=1 Tax=Streptomyces sp. NPDC091272 TaxID=3365981 RepID=UPI0038153826
MSSRPFRGAARLAAILDALPDGLLLVNCNGTVVNANTIALETFETPGTALVGRGLLDLLPEFDSKLIPGSMRRPDNADALGRTKPTRMIARRTDGSEFPVEVTSANLEDGRDAFTVERHPGSTSLTGDELLMLVVRDLSGTVDTEAELARSQRQTEMILRAASEGVVGTDNDGRIVLANPAAAQILGFRASDLGGKELHTLAVHSRADGTPFPYDESPLADTLKSGRKHRVRGQVLWAKNGKQVPVDLTTAPVRDGEQLVGAVMTFTDRRAYEEQAVQHAEELEQLTALHAEELASTRERYDAEVALGQERYEELAGQHAQLSAVLGGSLRGPLEELRGELGTLASDPAGQLWPEANQVLHHLAAGYARMTTLVDNVLGFQRLAAGTEPLVKANVSVDGIVAAAVEGAVELIGPGRAQFAVHAPPIEAEVDGGRLATALAHLVADVAGVDSTGKAPAAAAGGGYVDSTIVVAAAQRGEVVRFEVRGPYAGGDPVHEPIVRGIVAAHGGVLQTHEVPGMSGSAYVLEVPLGAGAGATAPAAPSVPAAGTPSAENPPAEVADGAGSTDGAGDMAGHGAAEGHGPTAALPAQQGGGRRARRSSTDAFLDANGGGVEASPGALAEAAAAQVPSGRRRARRGPADEQPQELIPAQGTGEGSGGAGGGTGRRRGRPSPAEGPGGTDGTPSPSAPGAANGTGSGEAAGTGGAGRAGDGRQPGQALALPGPTRSSDGPSEGSVVTAGEGAAGRAALGKAVPPQGVPQQGAGQQGAPQQGSGHQGSGQQGVDPHGVVPPQGVPQGPGAHRGQGVPPQGLGTQGVSPQGLGTQGVSAQGLGPQGAHAHASAAQPEGSQAPSGRRDGGAMPALPPAGRTSDRTDQARTDQAQMDQARADRARAADRTDPAGQAGHDGRPGQPVQGGQAGPSAGTTSGPAGPVSAPAPGPGSGQAGEAGRTAGPGQAEAPYGLRPPGAEASAMPGTGNVPGPGGNDTDPAGNGAPSADDTSGHGQVFAAAGAAQYPGHARASAQGGPAHGPGQGQAATGSGTSGGRRARRALATAPAAAEAESARSPFALPPADADRAPGRAGDASAQAPGEQTAHGGWPTPAADVANPEPRPLPLPQPHNPSQAQPLPLPAESTHSTQGRAFSVRTLGQGMPFAQQIAQQQNQTLGSGRRRRLATPSESERPAAAALAPSAEPSARPHPQGGHAQDAEGPQPGAYENGAGDGAPTGTVSTGPDAPQLIPTASEGRAYAIGAPDEGSEGPQPLDGPGGAVEVSNRPVPQPVDDELPPEPLDNPRRLLVWPAPDASTEQALGDRGYRPVIVHSREEVDAQIAAFPAALFVDPLTGPITRTALQSLRQAAVAAEVPVLVTAGLGQATREAAYGADPAVLLKALAPRDSEQHPPRVLLIEEHEEIALALTATLERRGMQVARAATDTEAVSLATQMRPNLVVMDLMLVRRRRAGIVDWLRANGQLNRTPLVVYTSAGLDQAQLPPLSSGETVLFLAERSTSTEVQSRIVDLLAKIGTN